MSATPYQPLLDQNSKVVTNDAKAPVTADELEVNTDEVRHHNAAIKQLQQIQQMNSGTFDGVRVELDGKGVTASVTDTNTNTKVEASLLGSSNSPEGIKISIGSATGKAVPNSEVIKKEFSCCEEAIKWLKTAFKYGAPVASGISGFGMSGFAYELLFKMSNKDAYHPDGGEWYGVLTGAAFLTLGTTITYVGFNAWLAYLTAKDVLSAKEPRWAWGGFFANATVGLGWVAGLAILNESAALAIGTSQSLAELYGYAALPAAPFFNAGLVRGLGIIRNVFRLNEPWDWLKSLAAKLFRLNTDESDDTKLMRSFSTKASLILSHLAKSDIDYLYDLYTTQSREEEFKKAVVKRTLDGVAWYQLAADPALLSILLAICPFGVGIYAEKQVEFLKRIGINAKSFHGFETGFTYASWTVLWATSAYENIKNLTINDFNRYTIPTILVALLTCAAIERINLGDNPTYDAKQISSLIASFAGTFFGIALSAGEGFVKLFFSKSMPKSRSAKLQSIIGFLEIVSDHRVLLKEYAEEIRAQQKALSTQALGGLLRSTRSSSMLVAAAADDNKDITPMISSTSSASNVIASNSSLIPEAASQAQLLSHHGLLNSNGSRSSRQGNSHEISISIASTLSDEVHTPLLMQSAATS